MLKKFAFLFALLAILSTSCKKKEVDHDAEDKATIEKYLKDHNLTALPTPEGLYYIINTPGSDAHPTVNNTVTVNYKGYLVNGAVFDQATAATFLLGKLIPGWQLGLPKIGKGGKMQLFVPSSLGYGDKDLGKISPYSVLIFDMELVDFK